MSKADLKVTFDHDEIRRWAEERNAAPACVRGTGSAEDIGMIRLDFPGYSGEQSLERIEWDEWFKKSDERNLALLYQETTAAGVKSNFNKLLSRETAEGAEQYGHSELVGSGHKKKAGESTPRHLERAAAVRRRAAAQHAHGEREPK